MSLEDDVRRIYMCDLLFTIILRQRLWKRRKKVVESNYTRYIRRRHIIPIEHIGLVKHLFS